MCLSAAILGEEVERSPVVRRHRGSLEDHGSTQRTSGWVSSIKNLNTSLRSSPDLWPVSGLSLQVLVRTPVTTLCCRPSPALCTWALLPLRVRRLWLLRRTRPSGSTRPSHSARPSPSLTNTSGERCSHNFHWYSCTVTISTLKICFSGCNQYFNLEIEELCILV